MNFRIMKINRLISTLSVVVILASCGGGSNEGDASADSQGTETSDLSDSLTNKGIGPVQSVSLGPLDATMAAKGKEIFTSKCASCHKFDVKYVGPPLQNITKRRAPEWIMNQMLNPEKMIKEDPLSKSLFEKYLVPMTFQNLTQDDARAILEYFRTNDQ